MCEFRDSSTQQEADAFTNALSSEVSVEEANAYLQSQNHEVALIDCRESREYLFCHIEGSVLFPITELPERADELEAYRDKHMIVYCHHGGRSLQFVNYLRNSGFNKAQNMTGGIDQWSQLIDQNIPRY